MKKNLPAARVAAILLAIIIFAAPFGLAQSPPVAINDTAFVPIDTFAFTIFVQANDSDPDGDPLTTFIIDPPNNGAAAEINGDSTFYTPDPGFCGIDSFTYMVCDTGVPMLCDTALVFITIINCPPSPVITPDTAICEFTAGAVYCTPFVVGHSYLWTSIAGGTAVSVLDSHCIVIDWGAGGSGSLWVKETDDGTGANVQANITVQKLPYTQPQNNGKDSVCVGVEEQYCTPNVAGDTYLWGVNSGNIVGDSTDNCVTITWESQGPTDTGVVCLTQSSPSGCDSTLCKTVYINIYPTPSISGPATVDENTGGNLYTTAFVPGNTYTWTITGGVAWIGDNPNEASVTWASWGQGQVCVTQQNQFDCDSTTCFEVTVDAVIGINEDFRNNLKARIFPHPVNDLAVLEFDNPTSASFELTVYDLAGKSVLKYSGVRTGRLELDVGDLESGVYFYVLTSEKGDSVFGKVVVGGR